MSQRWKLQFLWRHKFSVQLKKWIRQSWVLLGAHLLSPPPPSHHLPPYSEFLIHMDATLLYRTSLELVVFVKINALHSVFLREFIKNWFFYEKEIVLYLTARLRIECLYLHCRQNMSNFTFRPSRPRKLPRDPTQIDVVFARYTRKFNRQVVHPTP